MPDPAIPPTPPSSRPPDVDALGLPRLGPLPLELAAWRLVCHTSGCHLQAEYLFQRIRNDRVFCRVCASGLAKLNNLDLDAIDSTAPPPAVSTRAFL